MRHKVRSAAVTGVALVLAAGLAAGGSRAALGSGLSSPSRHTPTNQLTLTGGNVASVAGSGFKGGGAPVSNQLVATIEHVTLKTMNRYRIEGYQTAFSRKARSGLVSITDSVGLYKSVAGAIWEYNLFTGQNKVPPTAKTLSMSGIGQKARGYIVSTSVLSSSEVYLRRGIYTARLDVFAIGSLKSSTVLALSRILDSHLKGAH